MPGSRVSHPSRSGGRCRRRLDQMDGYEEPICRRFQRLIEPINKVRCAVSFSVNWLLHSGVICVRGVRLRDPGRRLGPVERGTLTVGEQW